MTGTALTDFNSFVSATASTHVKRAGGIHNLAAQNTYWIGRLLEGRAANKLTLRGGQSIKQKAIFEHNGTGTWYLPGATQTWENPQRLQDIEAYWRFSLVHMSWVEQEILLNDIITSGTEDAIYAQFASIREEKEMAMWGEEWDLMEDSVWRTPSADEMEGDGSGQTYPYSMFAFINEEADGLFTAGSSDFTQVEGLDPTAAAVNGNWTPQQVTYGSDVAGDPDGIVSRMDDLFMDTMFEQPPTYTEYFENDKYRRQIIVTSKRGRSIFMNLLRNSQDLFLAGRQDPAFPDPTMHGVPVTWAKGMTDAAVYPGSSISTEMASTATNRGPRFMLVNSDYLYPVFHQDRYFEKLEVTKHHEVPDTWVCPVSTYYQLFCTSRRHQGILSPNGTVYTS